MRTERKGGREGGCVGVGQESVRDFCRFTPGCENVREGCTRKVAAFQTPASLELLSLDAPPHLRDIGWEGKKRRGGRGRIQM